MYFYPRSPCGERPEHCEQSKSKTHFYPRSPCGERPGGHQKQDGVLGISIHALLAESDCELPSKAGEFLTFLSTLSLRRATLDELCRMMGIKHFYPRSPCGERLMHALKFPNLMLFLSTLSLRRATSPAAGKRAGCNHFYPRSPCGERQANAVDQILPGHISIHALLAESDALR